MRVTVGLILAGLVALALLLPVQLPSSVASFAAIAPEHRWVLARSTDGQLIASTFNYASGLSEGYRVSTFDPGSSVNFALHASLVPGRAIAIGDTIGSLYSSEVAERLIALNGQLAAARNILAVNASGQKSAIVKESQQRLVYAKRRREEYQRVYDRTQKLYDQHLIPANEYDRVQSEKNALDDEITIAAANVEAAETGAKPEQLELIHTNIAALQGEISAVKGRAATYTVTAPINGRVMPTFSPDTLVTITGPEYLALVPIRWSDYRRVADTPEARVTITGIQPPIRGRVVSFNPEVRMLGGKAVVIATARLERGAPDLMPGMLLPCRIRCNPVTPMACARQLVASLRTAGPLAGGF